MKNLYLQVTLGSKPTCSCWFCVSSLSFCGTFLRPAHFFPSRKVRPFSLMLFSLYAWKFEAPIPRGHGTADASQLVGIRPVQESQVMPLERPRIFRTTWSGNPLDLLLAPQGTTISEGNRQPVWNSVWNIYPPVSSGFKISHPAIVQWFSKSKPSSEFGDFPAMSFEIIW